MTRRLLCSFAAIIWLIALLSACGQKPETPDSSAARGQAPSTPSQAAPIPVPPSIEMLVQTYQGPALVEIPKVVTAQPSATADIINQQIQGFAQGYEELLQDSTQAGEIKTYPFLDDQYLQIVMTRVTYPIYGTYGKLVSFCYDWKADRLMTLQTIMEQHGLTKENLKEKFEKGAYFTPPLPVKQMTPVGFVLLPQGLQLFVEVQVANQYTDDWTYLYTYRQDRDDFVQYGNVVLFDSQVPLAMDPPLHYGKFTPQEIPPVWEAVDPYTGTDVVATLYLNADGTSRLETATGQSTTGTWEEYAMMLILRLENWPRATVPIPSYSMDIPTQNGQGFYMFYPQGSTIPVSEFPGFYEEPAQETITETESDNA